MEFTIGDTKLFIQKRDKLFDMLMGINNNKEITLEELQNQPTMIRDLVDLASTIGVDYSQLLNCYRHKQDYQVKLIVGDNRTVYKSKQPLSKVQQYIADSLVTIYKQLDSTHLLAYINGCNYITKIKERKGTYDVLVSLDIRKYFDSISKEHISVLLTDILGFNKAVSSIFAKLVTVDSKHPIFNYYGSFLQQGSTASPVLSNLIGYFFYDLDIKELLGKTALLLDKKDDANVEIEYFRYCDNLYIGIRNSIDIPKIKELVDNIKNIMKKAGFIVHKDRIITRTNPHIAQQILGITINNTPKIGDTQFNNKKASLVNIIAGGLTNIENNLVQLYDNSESNLVEGSNPLYKTGKVLVAKQILKGEATYYNNINKEQGHIINTLVDLVFSLYDKYKQNMDSINMDEVMQHAVLDGNSYFGFVTNDNVSIHNEVTNRQEDINNLYDNYIDQTDIIRATSLESTKLIYILNKVSELFKTDTYAYSMGDNFTLNYYIPVNKNNYKKLSSRIFKVVNNYRTNGILLKGVAPYGNITAPVYVNASDQLQTSMQAQIQKYSDVVNNTNNCMYKMSTSDDIPVSTLLLRLPIYYDSISLKISTLYKETTQENIDNLLNTILSGNSIVINVVFLGDSDYSVKQSSYQIDRYIRYIYNKLDTDNITLYEAGKEQSQYIPEKIMAKSISNLFK